MLCGCVVTLALSYIPLLFQTSHTIPRPMRNFLLVYVTFMVAVSTVNTVTLIIAFAIGRKIFKMHTGPSAEDNASGLDPDTFPNGLAGALCAIFASWGADGFMVRSLKSSRLDVNCRTISSFLLDIAMWDGMVWRVATSAILIVGFGSPSVRGNTRYGPESLYPPFLY